MACPTAHTAVAWLRFSCWRMAQITTCSKNACCTTSREYCHGWIYIERIRYNFRVLDLQLSSDIMLAQSWRHPHNRSCETRRSVKSSFWSSFMGPTCHAQFMFSISKIIYARLVLFCIMSQKLNTFHELFMWLWPGCEGVVRPAPEGTGRIMQSTPERSDGFDVIIRPAPEGARQTTPEQTGQYSHYNTKFTNSLHVKEVSYRIALTEPP